MKSVLTLGAIVAALSFATVTPSQAGVTLNGVTLNGARLNGLATNDVKWNGVKSNELKWNGRTATGAHADAVCAKADCLPTPRAIVLPSGERIQLR